ncbi:hypothetical protein ACH5RR_003467 [Cinchona calisaya]|uniref:Uncharacterized protein n=1 Tax=Cinchona calisaya TaxID=153742 RepID=A0ABD3AUY8_9GENT
MEMFAMFRDEPFIRVYIEEVVANVQNLGNGENVNQNDDLGQDGDTLNDSCGIDDDGVVNDEVAHNINLGEYAAYVEYASFQNSRKEAHRLVETFDELFPGVEHRLCVIHMYANFKLRFKDKALRDIMWAATKAYEPEICRRKSRVLEMTNKDADNWLSAIPPYLWARCMFSPRSKCDLLCYNIGESFNQYISAARDEPIYTMFETIRRLIMREVLFSIIATDGGSNQSTVQSDITTERGIPTNIGRGTGRCASGRGASRVARGKGAGRGVSNNPSGWGRGNTSSLNGRGRGDSSSVNGKGKSASGSATARESDFSTSRAK